MFKVLEHFLEREQDKCISTLLYALEHLLLFLMFIGQCPAKLPYHKKKNGLVRCARNNHPKITLHSPYMSCTATIVHFPHASPTRPHISLQPLPLPPNIVPGIRQ